MYSVELSAYIDTLALLKISGKSLVKMLKSKRPKQLSWGTPDSNWIIFDRLPLKNTLCVLLDKELFIHSITGGVKAIKQFFPAADYDQ